MNYDDLESAWRSPRNTPDAATLAAARDRFVTELDRRRRGTRVFLALVLAALLVITGRVALAVLLPLEAGVKIDFAREWAALLFLAVPWFGFGLLVRRMLRHEREHAPAAPAVRDAVRALLDENAMARGRLKVVAGLHGAVLVLLPLVVVQLRATGKAGDEILWPAFVGWPLVAGTILGALLWHDRKRLLPRRRQLEGLLRDYGQDD